MRAAVGALGDDPGGIVLHARLAQQKRERNAGPFRAGNLAEQFLRRCVDGAGRDRVMRRVAGAFEKADMRYHRIAQQLLDGELDRAFDEAVNHEAVIAWHDVWNAVVMDAKMKAVRRDDAIQFFDRRMPCDEARHFGCLCGHFAQHTAFAFGGQAIGQVRSAECFHPVRNAVRQALPARRRGGSGFRRRCRAGGEKREAGGEEGAALDQAAAGGGTESGCGHGLPSNAICNDSIFSES